MTKTARLAAALLALSTLGIGTLATASSWTIPGIVNTSGLNNTHFVSDFTATNPGTGETQLTLSFFPSSSSSSRTVTLKAGETVVYRDVVGGQFALSGVAGALSITSDAPLLLRARTYNTASSGTYGVALPVYEDERLLTPGETGDSLWITQDASGASGYRTNVAVVFPNVDGGEAVVTVYDADGNERGTKTFSLEAAGFQQFSVGSFAGAVPVGRARIRVTRGRAAGYGVVVDNVTGDSSLFTFDDLPGGRQDVLVNGVARANGRNETFFRTDARFYNSTKADATVAVTFHAAGNANLTPATASFTLPAGKIRDVVDVLDALLALPVGSAGALRFRSDRPVAILCRTSNVDPLGVKPGTFGSQQKPVPLLSFLSSADAGAIVAGIRQNAAFRTNIGFAAGPDGARYTLTLTTAAGTAVASASGSLGANGWAQPNVQDLFPSVAIPGDAAVLVQVSDGSLDVYDSSIDNASGDSVLTPIAPLPAAIPASASIGPAGGSIRSTDGRLTLKVPAGALPSAVTLSLETSPSNAAPQGIGSSYRLSPGGLSFARPALLAFRYGDGDVAGSSAGELGLAVSSGGQWYAQTGGVVDASARALVLPIGADRPTPLAVAGARRALLAGAPEEWAPFVAFRVAPETSVILTEAQTNLTVFTTGRPSSSGPNVGFFVLGPPANPADLEYQWSLYGDNAASLKSSGAKAVYTAPSCVPSENPVLVEVHLIKPERRDDEIVLQSWVLVVPRKWELTITGSAEAPCSGPEKQEIVDNVTWTQRHEFTLDDNTNVFSVDKKQQLLTPPGTPALCVKPGCGSVTGIERRGTLILNTQVGPVTFTRKPANLAMRISVELVGPDDYLVYESCPGAGSLPPIVFFGNVLRFSWVNSTTQFKLTGEPLSLHVPNKNVSDIDTRNERTKVQFDLSLRYVCP